MQQASVPSRGDSKMVEKSLGLLKKSRYVTAGTDLQPHAGHLLPRTTEVLRRMERIPRLAVSHYHLEQREG